MVKVIKTMIKLSVAAWLVENLIDITRLVFKYSMFITVGLYIYFKFC